jgi:ankyrin repeat protein
MTVLKSISKKKLKTMPKWKTEALLVNSIKNGSLKNIKLALNLGMNPNIALEYAIKSGNLSSVIYILKHDKIDKLQVVIRACLTAIMSNKLEILKFLVENDWVGFDYENHSLLTVSAREGRVDMVDFLLKDSHERFCPEFDYQQAIMESARVGHYEVVERLLQEKNVDPTYRFCKAISNAAHFGHKKIFELLLNDKRVFNSLSETEIIRYKKILNDSVIKLRKYKIEKMFEDINNQDSE